MVTPGLVNAFYFEMAYMTIMKLNNFIENIECRSNDFKRWRCKIVTYCI